MKTLSRLCVCGLAALALVLPLGAVLVPWLGGPDPLGELAEVVRQYLEEERRSEELGCCDEAMMRCLDVKRDVTIDVAAGRLTLLQGAERFRAAGAQCREREKVSWMEDEDEAVCRNVIAWAQAHLKGDPRSGKVVADLEAQLRRHLEDRRKGPL